MDASTSAAVFKWAFDELAAGFASVFEAMAAVRPAVSWTALPNAPAIESEDSMCWTQQLGPLPGAVFAAVTQAGAAEAGQHVMLAAGIEDCTPEELRSTWVEALGQVFAVLGRGISARLGAEIAPKGGKLTTEIPTAGKWAALTVVLGSSPLVIHVALPEELLESLAVVPKANAATQSAGEASSSVPATMESARGAADDSRTFDLLLEVELPVSVSFGHAQVPLKDVLKLTSGSIVELSRAIVEPVDIVVNNCVIARGEVVVVEGNFGVRIQHVVSRHERLRTLK
ncbi:MAG: flagellar motor switch protein FliN [Acidobacteriota bacterium]